MDVCRHFIVAMVCCLTFGQLIGGPAQADPATFLLFREGEDTLSVLGQNLCGLGDINSDGFDDVAFSSYQPRGTYVFHGGNPADSIADYFLRGAGNMTAGIDMTGDGIPDLVIQESEDRLLLYRGFGDSLESVASDSLRPSFLTYAYGYSVTSGLMSGDSIGDLALVDYNYPGGGRAYYYENPFLTDSDPDWVFTNYSYQHGMGSVDFIDFDGDDQLDLVMTHPADLDSVSEVYVFCGPDLDTLPDIVIQDPLDLDTLGFPNGRWTFGLLVYNIGDISGDGWEDLAILYNHDPVIYFGGPAYDTLYDMVLDEGGGWPTSSAGDVNGDGWPDLACGRSQTWFGAVDVFLGGPRLDSVSDYTVFVDDFSPWPRHSILLVGHDIAPAGDFNGDGFDDLLIHNLNFECCDWEYSSVYVLAGGPYIVTGSFEPPEAPLPTDFTLLQNHPNPFNSSTTISFSLPVRQHVKLRILNIMGREVITLLDQVMPVGKYSVLWNAVDNEGNNVASGVYFCVLTRVDRIEAKKMLFLK